MEFDQLPPGSGVDIYRKLTHNGFVTIRDARFLILATLADQSLHGYGIISEVKKISDGRVKLGPGTLYGTLDRLKDEGLIEESGTEEVDGRLRRYYRITEDGLAAVRSEAADRAATLRAAEEHISPRLRGASA